MATAASVLSRVRLELGDLPETFRSTIAGNNEQDDFDLNGRNILAVEVYEVNPDGTHVTVPPTAYTVETVQGRIQFVVPPTLDEQIVVEGTTYGIFSDDELGYFVEEALEQHLQNRSTTRRYRDGYGFIKYDRVKMELENLPKNENILVTLLASIEALWALSTDASMDIDVQTSEGTSLPRSQRFRQIVDQIQNLSDKYERLSLAMGVGLYAPETMTVRRVSRQTGRLVPIYVPREYDEYGEPVRVIPPITKRFSDPDGPRSPWRGGGAYGN